MVEIRAMIEVIAQHEVLQIAIAVELLIIVIGDGIEAVLVLHPEHRNAVASEVAARHGYDVSR